VAEGFTGTGKLPPTPRPPPIKGGGDNEGPSINRWREKKGFIAVPSTIFEFIDMNAVGTLIPVLLEKSLIILFSLSTTGSLDLHFPYFSGTAFSSFSPSLDGRGLGGG
jgi:hypothetical protein